MRIKVTYKPRITWGHETRWFFADGANEPHAKLNAIQHIQMAEGWLEREGGTQRRCVPSREWAEDRIVSVEVVQ